MDVPDSSESHSPDGLCFNGSNAARVREELEQTKMNTFSSRCGKVEVLLL